MDLPVTGAPIATAEELVAQLVAYCWPHEALTDPGGAQARGEALLERLVQRGLPFAQSGGGRRFDPYQAGQALVRRAGEPCDEAWLDWQRTARRNFRALDGAPRWLRFRLRREWLALPRGRAHPLVLRLPLPLREPTRALRVALQEPAGALLAQSESEGRVELRLRPEAAQGPVIAELEFEFLAGETRASWEGSAPLGEPLAPGSPDALWLAPREGMIVRTPAIDALAARLAQGCRDVAQLAEAIWSHLFAALRFGDLHRDGLPPGDPLAALLGAGWSDCALGASLFCALCRARGVPARLLSGYLVAPGLPALHSWAEVRVAEGRWAPIDLAAWVPCGGDPRDPEWGQLFFGRVNPRLTCEVAPHQFTGWGSARPPPRWLKMHHLARGGLEQELRALPSGETIQRDLAWLERA